MMGKGISIKDSWRKCRSLKEMIQSKDNTKELEQGAKISRQKRNPGCGTWKGEEEDVKNMGDHKTYHVRSKQNITIHDLEIFASTSISRVKIITLLLLI